MTSFEELNKIHEKTKVAYHRCNELRQLVKRPVMTDQECRTAVERVLNRLDESQAFNRNAMINMQQVRDLLDPGGMWSFSYAEQP